MIKHLIELDDIIKHNYKINVINSICYKYPPPLFCEFVYFYINVLNNILSFKLLNFLP